MEAVIILPAILAAVICVLRAPVVAFLNVYLPALLLIPMHFRWEVSGLPDFGFQHTVILTIACILPFVQRIRWRLSVTDLLVLCYGGVVAYSEYRAMGWKDAQNLIVDQLCLVLLPYAMAKVLIRPEAAGPAFAGRITVMLAAVAALSIWEFRMGQRLFFETLWGALFPDEPQPGVQYRWGFGRIGGPYQHAIHAGIIFGIGILLQAWLLRSKAWKERRSGLIVLALVVMGSALTMSRGPWLGTLLGGCVAAMGFARNRARLALRLGVVALVVAPLSWQFVKAYTAVAISRTDVAEERHSAAYRGDLLDVYMPRIMAQAEFGYGSRKVPLHRSYRSIDNHYIFLALQHGVIAVMLFATLMLLTCVRLAAFAARGPPRDATGDLAFTLAGALLIIASTLLTVFLSAQVGPILFLLLGWSEGLLGIGAVRAPAAVAATLAPPRLHSFQRVMR